MIGTGNMPFTMNVEPSGSNNGGVFGGNDAWIIIILFALIFGWGNGGWGANGGGTYLGENYALITDNATLERKIDGVYSGICDSTFALNNTITNGFAAAQNTMTQGFAGLNTAIVTQGYENRLGQQNIGQQMATCCCDLKGQIADVNYNMAAQANMIDRGIADGFCKTNFNAATNTRDIVDSANANTRAILDKLCQMESNAKDERIAELTAKNADLRLAASQAAQNEYLVNRLDPHPCPVSAYVVQPPQTVSFATNCNGMATFSNGCGCNQFYNGTTIA